MSMLRNFLSQMGSSMLQVMLALAVVGGGSAYYLKNINTQEKAMKFASYRMKANTLTNEISMALTDSGACLNTLKQNPNILDDMAGILNANGLPMYIVGSQLYGGTITRIRLMNYSMAAGQRQSNPFLRLTIMFYQKTAKADGTFGSYHKDYDIPIFMIAKDNVPQLCMSDETGTVAEVIREACEQLGGTYDIASGECKNLTGPTSIFLTQVKTNLCNTGPNCPHPYAGKTCTGKDTRGVDHGNWVLSNFKTDGTFNCKCMPRACPDPSLICQGGDNGTNWCDADCPKGTWNPQDWTPDPSLTCSTATVQQTNSCNATRTVSGTKDCSVATSTTTTTTTSTSSTSSTSETSTLEYESAQKISN